MQASGKYVAFLDADDLWKKNKLKKQIFFMEKKSISFSFTSYEVIDENNLKINKVIKAKNLNYEKLLKSCDIGLSTVIAQKKLMTKFKFPNLLTKEDFVVWLSIAKKNIEMKESIKIYAYGENHQTHYPHPNFRKSLMRLEFIIALKRKIFLYQYF